MINNTMVFTGLVILSFAAGSSQGAIVGWAILGIGLILIGLIEKYEG